MSEFLNSKITGDYELITTASYLLVIMKQVVELKLYETVQGIILNGHQQQAFRNSKDADLFMLKIGIIEIVFKISMDAPVYSYQS